MAKARKKRSKTANPTVAKFLRPTEAREAHNDFRSAGAAVRVVPVIVRLHEAGVLNEREFAALAYYRDQASLADTSPVRSCCDFSPRGGHGPGVAILSAAIETGRIEANMGPLWALCRAVAVDDVTLEGWVVSRRGAIPLQKMHAQDAKAWMDEKIGIAALELKYAAGGIVVGRG